MFFLLFCSFTNVCFEVDLIMSRLLKQLTLKHKASFLNWKKQKDRRVTKISFFFLKQTAATFIRLLLSSSFTTCPKYKRNRYDFHMFGRRIHQSILQIFQISFLYLLGKLHSMCMLLYNTWWFSISFDHVIYKSKYMLCYILWNCKIGFNNFVILKTYSEQIEI